MFMGINAIGYMRTSAEDDGYGLDVQDKQIRIYAEQNGITIVKCVSDTISGSVYERPALMI
jgi:DNA invertase Pin-like site-specific DNA recombinase